MSTQFETGLPSVRQVQKLIGSQQVIEIKLVTGDTLTGPIRWQDANAICLQVESQTMILMRGAIAYIKSEQLAQ